MTVWDDLVGQEKVAEQLDAAARDADALVTAVAADAPEPEASKMTHSCLFTLSPGAGWNQAARAFAAALQCVSPDRALGGSPGCGFCDGCHTALVGTHADVTTVAAVGAQILADDMRDTVRKSYTSPANGRWQVILVEDAERLNEKSANAVLKAVEEPAPRTVWLLCAPSIEDVLPTIRSRCRHLNLLTPSVDAVADMLVRREGVEPAVAAAAARATQGHVDRARRLATDPAARERRAAVLKLPLRVEEIGGALRAAQELVDAAAELAETSLRARRNRLPERLRHHRDRRRRLPLRRRRAEREDHRREQVLQLRLRQSEQERVLRHRRDERLSRRLHRRADDDGKYYPFGFRDTAGARVLSRASRFKAARRSDPKRSA